MNLVRSLFAMALFAAILSSPGLAQDIRGIENCSAEKQMERRTGCLQANVEFLQQALLKQAKESNEKLAAANREIIAAKAEITVLKAALVKINGEIAQIKAKAEPAKK